MVGAERALEVGELARPGQALDRLDRAAVGLDGEDEARADGGAVEADGAGAADAVLASDVRAGQPEAVAQEVGEQQAGLDAARGTGGR